jgi:hypothetical protein
MPLPPHNSNLRSLGLSFLCLSASLPLKTSLCVLCVLLFKPASIPAQPLEATLTPSTAWTGQALNLNITLTSPGPFSGTAAFDLPEIPGLYFVKTGSPTVGSKEIDGQSLFTQDHAFFVFSQRDGELTIPPFQVRYEGKPSFTADPEPFQGTTPELTFTTNRPPGMSPSEIVVVTPSLDVTQSWSPTESDTLDAGDAIVRTITRKADGTSAIMLPPPPDTAPEGIRVYPGNPQIEDLQNRGDLEAQRTDQLTYQFEKGGAFTLPEITFSWWDPQSKTIRTQTLEGKTLQVDAAPASTSPKKEESPSPTRTLFYLAVAAFLIYFLQKFLRRALARIQTKHNAPAYIAARQLTAACKTNNPRAAYGALNTWLHLTRIALTSELEKQLNHLTHTCFNPSAAPSPWTGSALLQAFRHTRRQASRHPHQSSHKNPALPRLNPI